MRHFFIGNQAIPSFTSRKVKKLEHREEKKKTGGGDEESEAENGKKERSVLQTKLSKLAIQLGYIGEQR